MRKGGMHLIGKLVAADVTDTRQGKKKIKCEIDQGYPENVVKTLVLWLDPEVADKLPAIGSLVLVPGVHRVESRHQGNGQFERFERWSDIELPLLLPPDIARAFAAISSESDV